MKKIALAVFVSLFAFVSTSFAITYPGVYHKKGGTQTVHGKKMTDSYRWMENFSNPTNAKILKSWVAKQDALTKKYIGSSRINYYKNQYARLTKYNFMLPVTVAGGGYYYQWKGVNDSEFILRKAVGGKRYNKINFAQLNNAKFKKAKYGKKNLSLNRDYRFGFTNDGKTIVYGLSVDHGDFSELYYHSQASLSTNNSLANKIPNNYILSYMANPYGNGVFYATSKVKDKVSSARKNFSVYYYNFNTKRQTRIYTSTINSEGIPYVVGVTPKYVVLGFTNKQDGNNIRVFNYSDIVNAKGKYPSARIFAGGAYQASYVGASQKGGILYFMTNRKAPMGKVVQYFVSKGKWKVRTVLKQGANSIKAAFYLYNKLIVIYNKDGVDVMNVYNNKGQLLKTLFGSSSNSKQGSLTVSQNRYLSFRYMTMVDSGKIYYYDAKTNKLKLYYAFKTVLNPKDFKVIKAFYRNRTKSYKFPVFIVVPKSFVPGRSRPIPMILSGYGGFGIPVYTGFLGSGTLAWIKSGGGYAVAAIRGGGLYGDQWKKDGVMLNKKNSYYDFIAAGKYLINKGYTTNKKLGLQGASNGGTLVAASMTMSPGTFAAVNPQVGVFDMLNFDKSSYGDYWKSQYGDPKKNRDHYNYVMTWSPYHKVSSRVKYPAVLFSVGDNDPRVPAWQSYKMAARLQKSAKSGGPYFLFNTGTGHGGGSTEQIGKNLGVEFGFFAKYLGLRLPGQ